jgi:hypothetical protein
MQPERPVLYAALICERVLHEEDGVNTLFRVIDTINIDLRDVSPDTSEQALQVPESGVPLQFFLYTKWGGPAGQYTERVTLIDTNNQEHNPWPEANFELRGGHYFQQIRHVIPLQIQRAGRYALRVYLNDHPFVEVPFQVNMD